MRWYYQLQVKYHKKMRDMYEKDGWLQNDIKIIYHDLRLQRYENKLSETGDN
jgi:hypothetical protein